ncbi:MAG: sensor histidine kinase [Flavobacteriia bacterium]|jgi:signal transduction histidine kinase
MLAFFKKNYLETDLKKALKSLDSINKNENLSKYDQVRWHINYSNHLFKAQKYALANEKIIAGLKINELVKNDTFSIYFYKNQGNCYYYLSLKDKALPYYLKGLEVAEKINHLNEIAQLSNNIGAMYSEQHNFSKSEYYLLKSIENMKKSGANDKSFMTYRILASLYDENNKFKEASSIYQKLISLSKTFSDSNLISTAYSYYCNHFILRKMYDSAQVQIDKSFLYLKNSNHYASLLVANDINSHLAFLKNDFRSAYFSLKKSNELREKINKTEQQKAISDLEIKYETEKKEQDLKLKIIQLKQSQERSSYILVLSILSIFILLIVVVFIFIRIRWKQKTKAEIERVKKEQEIAFTKEQERTRIARELHDNIGSTISYITKKTEAILEDNQSGEIQKGDLIQVKESAQEIMGGLRETLWALNSKEITNIDLIDKLKVYIKKHALIPFKIEDKIELEHIIPNESALAIFRCSQEIINNCNKHSEAKNLKIQFNTAENILIQLIFCDDGIGFDLKEKSEHYGLKNLKSRLEEIAAIFEISSKLGEGTNYEILLKKNQI